MLHDTIIAKKIPRDFPALAGLTLLWWLAALLVGISGDFPLNDDWHYGALVRSHLESGAFRLGDEISPNLFLQLFWGELFCRFAGGFSFTWLRLSTLVLGWAAVLLLFGILRRRGSGAAPAFWGALLFAFSPVFFSLSFTFMTDVPFFAAVLASMGAFAAFLQSRRPGYRLAGYLFALAAYLIRLPGIFIIPAFELALWISAVDKRRQLPWLAAGLALSAAFFLLMEQWVKPALGLSSAAAIGADLLVERHFSEPVRQFLQFGKNMLRGLFITGFFCLPLTPQIWRAAKKNGLLRPRRWWPLAAFVVTLTGALWRQGWVFPFSEGGNIFYNFGLGPPLLRDWYFLHQAFPLRLPELLMIALGLWSQLLGMLLLLLLVCKVTYRLLRTARVSKSDRSQALISTFPLFLLVFNAAYLLSISAYSYHDRYFLLPFAAVLIWMIPARDKFPLPGNVLLMILAGYFAVTATHDYLAWNRTAHQLAGRLQARGIPAANIDGGIAYNGWHSGETNNLAAEKVIAFQQIPGYEAAGSAEYSSWLFLRPQTIWVLTKKEEKRDD